MPDKKECFLISPIGEENSPTRKLANTLRDVLIKPAVGLDYEVLRADDVETSGDISDRVIVHLRNAPIAVAILHKTNPNVYYEMAVRHTLAKPLILIAPEGLKLPFDIRFLSIVRVDLKDHESVSAAKKVVARQLQAFESDPSRGVNPVTRALGR